MNPEETTNPEVESNEQITTPTDSQTEQTSQDVDLSPQRPSDDYQERNWKAMRERQEQLLRENERLRLEQEMIQRQNAPKEEEVSFSDDDLLTAKDTKKVINKEAERIARQIVQEQMKEFRKKETPNLVKQSMPDFNDVVTEENVNYLMKHKRHIANGFSHIEDPYEQYKATYEYLKDSGIYKGDSSKAMKQDAEVNSKKPVSPNALGQRNSLDDGSFPKRLTQEQKDSLYKEMLEFAR